MKVVFASDHAGYSLKESLRPFVENLGYEVVDVGAATYDPNDDYPGYCAEAARIVAREPETTRAVLLGGSGQGEAMVANRFQGVRAVVYNGESRGALYNELDEIALSREHNDANVLSLGARFMVIEEAKEVVERWLATPFSGEERHRRRIEAIDAEAARGMTP